MQRESWEKSFAPPMNMQRQCLATYLGGLSRPMKQICNSNTSKKIVLRSDLSEQSSWRWINIANGLNYGLDRLVVRARHVLGNSGCQFWFPVIPGLVCPICCFLQQNLNYIALFAKACAIVYGIFLHSIFGLYQSCKSKWAHLVHLLGNELMLASVKFCNGTVKVMWT